MRGLRRVVNARSLGDVFGGIGQALHDQADKVLTVAEERTAERAQQRATRHLTQAEQIEEEMRATARGFDAYSAPRPAARPDPEPFIEDPAETAARARYNAARPDPYRREWDEMSNAEREQYR